MIPYEIAVGLGALVFGAVLVLLSERDLRRLERRRRERRERERPAG